MFDEWIGAGREVAVIGLGRSGVAVSGLLSRHGVQVYASDESLAIADSAVEALQADGVVVDLGTHDLARIGTSIAVVVSPGVPPTASPILAAKKAGTPVYAEVDVAARALPPSTRIVGVTGTNGKTTTTALVAHLLHETGVGAVAAGNIGLPLSLVAGEEHPPGWVVVELSSFQLHDAPHLAPAVGIFTNLVPDHLDRYDSLEQYYADKANLFRNATVDSVWVINADDPEVSRVAEGVPGRHLTFSTSGPADARYDPHILALVVGDVEVLRRSDLRLLGMHNVSNALAAILAAQAAGAPLESLGRALTSFRPLAHRLEPVRTVDRVLWINDSKATNVGSTVMATAAVDQPFVLLLGGRHKGVPYSSLAPTLGRCQAVVAFGEAQPFVVRDLGDIVPVHTEGSFEDVIERARTLARPGDAVLLSPACSSFDMFSNYEERGTEFRRAVEAM